jgi:hypothetical protein
MTEQIAIGKTEVSKARKEGHASHKWYARKPVNIAGVNKTVRRYAGNQTYGKELTEEELFEHNQNKQPKY